MEKNKLIEINTPLGKVKPDFAGSPVGVVRMDVEKSYAGTGNLLQEYINNNSQDAWEKIREKIDYTYTNLDLALVPLEEETGLGSEVKQRLDNGQKMLFKPNLVNPNNIDPQTHGPDVGYTACTEWPFIAALMRWFHDKIGVKYHQMSIGEAATTMTSAAGYFSLHNPEGKIITTEAVIEGRSRDFYGGWGFYFVRKYLAEAPGTEANDDPMNGYEESISGTYIPPGQVTDKLMVYDLNRIFDEAGKGRECKIPDGINYKSITLHKVIVGGDHKDPVDREAYPGCILVNVPKFKVHAITLFTNIIKNLGIGLYPMQYAKAGEYKWDYSVPQGELVTGIKGGIPHQVWEAEIDHETGYPKRDGNRNYIVKKTGGITATMIDIIKATANQGVFMIHVVDGIETINIDHQGMNLGEKSPEGMVFAGLDPVAADTLCARYMFSNVTLKEALQANGANGFPQRVPVPTLDGNNIISKEGYDFPLSRDISFENAEKRGLGKMAYHVIGHDTVTDLPIISLDGHLGMVRDGEFEDLVTQTFFYDTFSVPWDLQKTTFAYLEAVEKLEGENILHQFLKDFDETGNGIVTYEEFGKKGVFGAYLNIFGKAISEMGSEKYGYLKGRFKASTKLLKLSNEKYNTEKHNSLKEFFLAGECSAALNISKLDIEIPDPFVPGLTCGKGKWPSLKLARFFQVGVMLYGQNFPFGIRPQSLYSLLLFYADVTQNGGKYAGKLLRQTDLEAVNRYMSNVSEEKIKPLDFTFYVPDGFDNLSGNMVPNVEITDDPGRLFTASFDGGKEIWR